MLRDSKEGTTQYCPGCEALGKQLVEALAKLEKFECAARVVEDSAVECIECEGGNGELIFSVTADAIHLLRNALDPQEAESDLEQQLRKT